MECHLTPPSGPDVLCPVSLNARVNSVYSTIPVLLYTVQITDGKIPDNQSQFEIVSVLHIKIHMFSEQILFGIQ